MNRNPQTPTDVRRARRNRTLRSLPGLIALGAALILPRGPGILCAEDTFRRRRISIRALISGTCDWDREAVVTLPRLLGGGMSPALLLTVSPTRHSSLSCISSFGGIDFYFVLFALTTTTSDATRKSPARQLGNFPRAI